MMVLLISCGMGLLGTPLVQIQSSAVEVVANNLEIPWSIAADENEGIFYVTQRTVSILKSEGDQVTEQSVELEKELSTASEAGILGFVLVPDFAETGMAFAYYTYKDENGQFNRTVRLHLDEATNNWQDFTAKLRCFDTG